MLLLYIPLHRNFSNHYMSLYDDIHADEVIRIFPSVFKRIYCPVACDETQCIGGFQIKTMEMIYDSTQTVCNLRTFNGPRIMIDSLADSFVLEGNIQVKMMPADVWVVVDFSAHIDRVTKKLSELISCFFPEILTLDICPFQDLITSQRCAIRTLVINNNRAMPVATAQAARNVPNLPTFGINKTIVWKLAGLGYGW